MKVTVITCDNCGASCPDGAIVGRIGDKLYDVCLACTRGEMVLEPPVKMWPKWVTREAVHGYLKDLEKGVTDNIMDVKKMRKELKRMNGELLEIFEMANRADALKDPWTARDTLREIVTIGKRASRNGE